MSNEDISEKLYRETGKGIYRITKGDKAGTFHVERRVPVHQYISGGDVVLDNHGKEAWSRITAIVTNINGATVVANYFETIEEAKAVAASDADWHFKRWEHDQLPHLVEELGELP